MHLQSLHAQQHQLYPDEGEPTYGSGHDYDRDDSQQQQQQDYYYQNENQYSNTQDYQPQLYPDEGGFSPRQETQSSYYDQLSPRQETPYDPLSPRQETPYDQLSPRQETPYEQLSPRDAYSPRGETTRVPLRRAAANARTHQFQPVQPSAEHEGSQYVRLTNSGRYLGAQHYANAASQDATPQEPAQPASLPSPRKISSSSHARTPQQRGNNSYQQQSNSSSYSQHDYNNDAQPVQEVQSSVPPLSPRKISLNTRPFPAQYQQQRNEQCNNSTSQSYTPQQDYESETQSQYSNSSNSYNARPSQNYQTYPDNVSYNSPAIEPLYQQPTSSNTQTAYNYPRKNSTALHRPFPQQAYHRPTPNQVYSPPEQDHNADYQQPTPPPHQPTSPTHSPYHSSSQLLPPSHQGRKISAANNVRTLYTPQPYQPPTPQPAPVQDSSGADNGEQAPLSPRKISSSTNLARLNALQKGSTSTSNSTSNSNSYTGDYQQPQYDNSPGSASSQLTSSYGSVGASSESPPLYQTSPSASRAFPTMPSLPQSPSNLTPPTLNRSSSGKSNSGSYPSPTQMKPGGSPLRTSGPAATFIRTSGNSIGSNATTSPMRRSDSNPLVKDGMSVSPSRTSLDGGSDSPLLNSGSYNNTSYNNGSSNASGSNSTSISPHNSNPIQHVHSSPNLQIHTGLVSPYGGYNALSSSAPSNSNSPLQQQNQPQSPTGASHPLPIHFQTTPVRGESAQRSISLGADRLAGGRGDFLTHNGRKGSGGGAWSSARLAGSPTLDTDVPVVFETLPDISHLREDHEPSSEPVSARARRSRFDHLTASEGVGSGTRERSGTVDAKPDGARSVSRSGILVEPVVTEFLEVISAYTSNGIENLSVQKKTEMEFEIQQKFNVYKTKAGLTPSLASSAGAGHDASRESSFSRGKSAFIHNNRPSKGSPDVRKKSKVLDQHTALEQSPTYPSYKQISDMMMTFIHCLNCIVMDFNDNDMAWNPKWKPPYAPSYIQDHPVRKKALQLGTQLITIIKNFLMEKATSFITESFQAVTDRIFSSINETRTPSPVPFDTSMFGKAQLHRSFKQFHLNSLLAQFDKLFTTATHFLQAVVHYSSEESEIYHLMLVGLTLTQAIASIQDDIETFFAALMHETTIVHQKPEKLKKSPEYNSWTGKVLESDDPDVFRPGSMTDLVKRMTKGTLSKDFFSAFIYCAHTVATPLEVWTIMKSRYYVPKDKEEFKQLKMIQVRVARWLLDWLKADLHAIDDGTLSEISAFAAVLQADGWKEISAWIGEELKLVGRFSVSMKEKPTCIPYFGNPFPPAYVLSECDVQTIAEQLTLHDWNLYKRVQAKEFSNQNWSKDKYKVQARNICDMILRVNSLSYFVGTTIVLARQYRTRAKVISKFISIAQALFDMNNLSSFIGIMTGLAIAPVSRLKHSWSKVHSSQLLLFKQLEIIQNPTSSYKALREHVAGIDVKKKCVPYIGTYLGDITFSDDGNKDWVGDKKDGCINFTKFHYITRGVNAFLKHQNIPFEYEPQDPVYSFLSTLSYLDEKELQQISLEREPRNSTIKDVD